MSRKDEAYEALLAAQRALQHENVETRGASGFPDDLMYQVEAAIARIERRSTKEDYYFTPEFYEERRK